MNICSELFMLQCDNRSLNWRSHRIECECKSFAVHYCNYENGQKSLIIRYAWHHEYIIANVILHAAFSIMSSNRHIFVSVFLMLEHSWRTLIRSFIARSAISFSFFRSLRVHVSLFVSRSILFNHGLLLQVRSPKRRLFKHINIK